MNHRHTLFCQNYSYIHIISNSFKNKTDNHFYNEYLNSHINHLLLINFFYHKMCIINYINLYNIYFNLYLRINIDIAIISQHFLILLFGYTSKNLYN